MLKGLQRGKHSLCRTTHVDPRRGGVGPFCNGVIDPDPTPVELHPICMLLGLKVKQYAS